MATISGATINGTPLGFGFNPLTDRVHIVTDAGQHVGINPDTGAAVVEPLTGGAGVTSIAFTDNRADTSVTTLLALNTTSDRFGRIDNPTTTGDFVEIGPIGVNAEPPSSLDVSAVDGAIFLGIRSNASTEMTCGGRTIADSTARRSRSGCRRRRAPIIPVCRVSISDSSTSARCRSARRGRA